MKIAVIGPGSMGLLFGGKLSQNAEVILIGHNAAHIHTINSDQVTIKRDGQAQTYKVPAFTNGTADGPADLIILFTKAYITRQALREKPTREVTVRVRASSYTAGWEKRRSAR